jgi:ankyrin repeat protein
MTYDSADDVLSQVKNVTEFLGQQLSDVNQQGIFGNTPLAVVVNWGEPEAVSRLIEAGANVNAQNENGDTALHRAVLFDQLEILDRLRDANASTSIRNDEGQTPLELARLLGKDAIIKMLMSW